MVKTARRIISIIFWVTAGVSALWLILARLSKPNSSASRSPETAKSNQTGISSWGNYPKVDAPVHEFQDVETLRALVQQLPSAIPRGNGRSYGDSALGASMISSLRYNKFLSFDAEQGVIRCQAGVLLSEILEVIVPQGWFLPVTPGTKLITVGGAIASDVHGKSQRKVGNFSDHLVDFEMMQADGSIVRCTPQDTPDLFWTTCGGMGLTGIILTATMRLVPIETAYIRQESIQVTNIDEMMDGFEASENWTYTLAWIDCLATGKSLGRGFIMRGEYATKADLAGSKRRKHPLEIPSKLKLVVPFTLPSFVLNRPLVRLFNMLLYYKHLPKTIKSIVDYDTFFYPLDTIYKWNRGYGPNGFTQYQFILPDKNSREGMRVILQKIADSNVASFLAVLKLYGHQNGYLPFAMDGFSLALDFPIRPGLFEFLDELDEIVKQYGGRVYLTKDVRMSAAMFKQTYPQAEQFMENLKQINPNRKFRSRQSDRIGVT